MMIGILMMATTVYLGWTDEKRKIIAAQWCINTIWWEINNFVFYTLTSKNLGHNSETISPDFYIVEFTWWNDVYCSSSNTCNKINLSYSIWDTPENIITYKTLNISNICQQNNQPLKFYRDWWETSYIIMNKWFSPRNIKHNEEIFYLSWNHKRLSWDVIVWLCLNDECSNPKEIWKFVADARSQTISTRNCKFYDDDDPTKCKTREGCQIYNKSDETLCEKY